MLMPSAVTISRLSTPAACGADQRTVDHQHQRDSDRDAYGDNEQAVQRILYSQQSDAAFEKSGVAMLWNAEP